MIDSAELILFVSDQHASRDFYRRVLGLEPELDVPGMTEFRLGPGVKLGLMPHTGIARILGDALPHPDSATGIPRCELYLRVPDLESCFERAIRAGAVIVSHAADRDWGDRVAYVADPDGHVLAFACPVSG